MSDDNQRGEYNQEKKKRRTRKDEQGRNFTCPCGKSYLSYPALYTHIKTKHHGKVKHYLAKAPKQDHSIVKPQIVQQNQANDPLTHIKQTVQKYFPGDDPNNYPNQISQQNKQYINFLLSQNFQSMKQNRTEQSNSNMNSSIDHIFSKFLFQMRTKVKAEAFRYLCQFMALFHQNILIDRNDAQYCKESNGMQLPNLFNNLILNKRVPDIQIKDNTPSKNLILACKVLFYLGIWLFDQRYTTLSAKFNVLSN